MGEGTACTCCVNAALSVYHRNQRVRGPRIPGSGSSAAPLRGARRSLVRDRVEWTNRSTRHCAASGEGTSHQFPVGGERKLASPIGS